MKNNKIDNLKINVQGHKGLSYLSILIGLTMVSNAILISLVTENTNISNEFAFWGGAWIFIAWTFLKSYLEQHEKK